MADAKRDSNYVPTLIAVSNADGITPVVLWADPTTHRLLVDSSGGGANTALSNLASVAINTALLPGTSDSIALGSATKQWSDLYLGSGALIDFNNGNAVITHSSGILTVSTGDLRVTTAGSNSASVVTVGGTQTLTAKTIDLGSNTITGTKAQFDTALSNDNFAYLGTAQSFTALQTMSLAGVPLRLVNTTDIASNQALKIESDRATPTDGDVVYASFLLSDDAGTQTEFGRISCAATDVNVGTSVDGSLIFGFMVGGTLANKVRMDSVNFYPFSNDLIALGAATSSWADLFLASGGVINWNNGNATITHSAGVLTLGGSGAVTLALGSNSITMTGSIAATGARVTKGWFTDIESTNIPTVGGTAILTSLTAPQFTTIELGAASDTTLSRVSAGVVAIEGVNILTVAGGTLTGNIVLGENTSIDLDPAGSADGKYSGIAITGTAGAALSFGQLIYLAVADSRWELTDADALATAGNILIGMCVLAAAGDGSATKILLQGQIRADAQFPALTIGAAVYVGETAGAIQVAIPTGADNVIRVVGFALTADEIYFNPSQDHQTTVA